MIKSTSQISYPVMQHSQQILSALNAITPDVQKISGSQKALGLIKKRTGIDLANQGLMINCDDRSISLFTQDRFTLSVKVQNRLNKKESLEFQIKNSALHGLIPQKENIEVLLENILDTIDFSILKLRKFFTQGELSSLLEKLSPKAIMDKKSSEISDEIKSLFQAIHSLLTSIPDNYTKLQIRNGYSAITSGHAKSKQLDFSQIGFPKADYSVNFIKDRKNTPLLIISIKEAKKEEQHIIIDPEYHVIKKANINRIYNFGNQTEYYSQRELDSWSFKDKLTILRDELIKYKAYLEQSIKAKKSEKEFYSTSEIGTIDDKCLKLIKDIKILFDACKAKMLKIKDTPRKNAFKNRYQIDTIMSSPSLIFKNISPVNENIHLSFPALNGEQCTKILIVNQYGEIVKSLFIENDRLVKFNASSIGRSKRKDTKVNYYSQEEINNSDLDKYLKLLKSRLDIMRPEIC